MTAQASDTLVFEGKSYWVRDFIDLPPNVSEPPNQMLEQSTAKWRGFLCKWHIRMDRGKHRLFLGGFDCLGGYFPLFEPKLNPISTKVKVVPQDSELLEYIHMGFESKFSGERYFVFINGALTDVEEIPDHLPNADGLLDLAKLHPLGEEEGLLRHSQATGLDQAESVMQIHTSCIACGDNFEYKQVPSCSDPEDAETHENPDEMHCARCIEELADFSQYLGHWEFYRIRDFRRPWLWYEWSPETHLTLYDVKGSKKRAEIAPELDSSGPRDYKLSRWCRSSGLTGCGYLSFSKDKREFIFRFFGHTKFIMREEFEFKDRSSYFDTKLEDDVRCIISSNLESFNELEISPTPGDPSVSVSKKLVVRVPLNNGGLKINPITLANRLEAQVDTVVRDWAIERKRIGPILRNSWSNAVSALTGGTGIYPYPYNPADLTPADSRILQEGVRNRIWLGHAYVHNNTVWVIRPRHTVDGWIPGETVAERYIKTLNL